MGSNPAACAGVSRALRQKHVLQRFATVCVMLAFECFRTAPPVRDCANGFGIRTMPRRLCLAGYRVPDKRINVFLWVPKVTGSILSGCILLGMGSNPAAVWVFRRRFGKSTSCNDFVGPCITWHGLDCFGTAPPRVLLGMQSHAAGVRVFRNRASSKGECANGFGIGTMPRRLCLAGYRVPDKRIN